MLLHVTPHAFVFISPAVSSFIFVLFSPLHSCPSVAVGLGQSVTLTPAVLEENGFVIEALFELLQGTNGDEAHLLPFVFFHLLDLSLYPLCLPSPLSPLPSLSLSPLSRPSLSLSHSLTSHSEYERISNERQGVQVS